MKLFVIVLCLLSERFLIHNISFRRFNWFNGYFHAINQRLQSNTYLANPLIMLLVMLLPVLLVSWLALYLFGHWLFGFIGLLLNIIIFYYCLGPQNPFYPSSEPEADLPADTRAGNYLAWVNGQLFAVVFWYIITGPLGIIIYRIISLCKEQPVTARFASLLTDLFDWLPARLTGLLYLLVGNFQQGFHAFAHMFFSSPQNNDNLLSTTGLLAARTSEKESVSMPYAENLVEHAIIVFLVFLAFFTMVAWL